MLRGIQERHLDRNRWIKISMGVILMIICVSMVVTLVPGLMSGPSTDASSPDAIASVGGRPITVVEFQQKFDRLMSNQQVPQMMRPIYARQLLNDMVFQQALDYEAQQLGLQVTPEEEAARIRELVPSAWVNNTWNPQVYQNQIQQATGMSVGDFESSLRESMLEEKFRDLVTDGINLTPAEVQQEFLWRNDRVKLQYALVKPTDLAPKIQPTDAELEAWFSRNQARYQIPEKRSVNYALLDLAKLRANTQVTDPELQAYYQAHVADYQVQNRAHVEHILFKTVGKTDAEVAEIRKKAADVLAQARKKGANFEDLAKKYSEDDASASKGGDLGWILQGQTVPAFEKAAFSVPKDGVSDLVTTPYGFEIIKVIDRETARTRSFAEVRDEVRKAILDQKVSDAANQLSGQLADAVRESDRQPLDALARKFNLELGQVPPVSATEPIGPLGNSQELHQIITSLQPGELSQPIQTDAGYVLLTVKDIVPAHQGTLAEVHSQVLADYQQEQSVTLAKQRAAELAQKVKAGEPLQKAAKDLGLAVATSDSFARNGSVPAVGSGRQLSAAFNLQSGQTGGPTLIEGNWVVYQVVSREGANQADFAAQEAGIKQQLLQSRQSAAFEAFRTSLLDKLRKEGKLTINSGQMNRFTQSS
ncbi:MAG: peptidyl-prolyl cis-trans isomerase [Acidobacteriota bacterium]|nr:peptidyl-prolyl cis-trans isomerase [Acidobacteriota bacterium]MDE3171060.1 peptidyl-prolyl cis-trans isomerase [Acidobacteriota bacterium]